MVFEKTLKLGFELEAGFNTKLRNSNLSSDENYKFYSEFKNLLKKLKFKMTGDGSIHSKFYPLELQSGVYEIKTKEDLKEVIDAFKQISKYIKDNNKSCGIHIHISFENLADYYTLLNFDFADNFLKKYEQKFKTNLEKERLINSFCKKYGNETEFKKITKQQLNAMHKGYRYYAVNYNSYNILKTIEFRLFPSTKNPNKFKDYVYFLYDYIIKHLKENDDGRIKKELIKKTRKFNKDTANEIITITDESIREDEFKNYVERKKKEQNERQEDLTRQILEREIDEDEEEEENSNPFYNGKNKYEYYSIKNKRLI